MTITLPSWQPEAGPGDPVGASPARQRGSVRRTTSLDIPWPDYGDARATIHLRGRDLSTPVVGAPTVLGSFDATVVAELAAGTVEAIDGVDAGPWRALVGARLRSGFGRVLAEGFPEAAIARPLGFSAFDDLPGAFLVSGYSMIRNGMLPEDPAKGPERAAYQADVCTGWAEGSPVHTVLLELGRTAIPYGPVAPALEADDPAGWHDLPALEHRAVRRQRMLDVQARDDGRLDVVSHFRDSYAADDEPMVMHEYLVHATVDPDRRIARLDVEARVLPWADCPGAVASAQALVGVALGEVDARARTVLAGPVGCTHLTSTLRALADATALVAELDGGLDGTSR